MCFFSTFYVVDVNCPIRLETKTPFPQNEFSLDSVPEILKPSRVRSGFDFQINSGGKKTIGSYQCQFSVPSVPNIFVFCWDKTIAASSDRTQAYYDGITFDPMDYVPQQQLYQPKKLEKLELLIANPTVIPTYKFAAFLCGLREMRDVSEVHRVIKQQYDSLHGKDTCTSTLVIVPEAALEVQLTKYTAEILANEFPEFEISIQNEDPSGTRNTYTPFFKSREDITGFIPICVKSKSHSTIAATMCFSEANGNGIESDDCEESEDNLLEEMTLEAKVEQMKEKDRFKLLANMEITATHIAKMLLSKNIPLHKIKVFGALLYCKENLGILFSLKMDFVNSKSEVRRLYKKLSIVQAVSYICHKFSTQE